jgi:Phosphoribosylformimino-5-aminoimidazole carboxamide ribonucleotide (ProFAR) isomerase
LASDFLIKIKNIGVSRIIYTDIERDGTLTRPNFEETIKIVKLLENKIPVVVSGGVGSINDIVAVKQHPEYFEGVIVGKAIYDGRLSVSGNIVNLLS